jgi:hypothetical protein
MALAIGLLVTVLSPAAVSAQSDLDTSETEAFIGDWNLPMDSEFGSFELLLEIHDQDGRVAANIGAPDFGMQSVTDITKSGETLILNYDTDAQGQLISVTVTLEHDGENILFQLDAAEGAFSVGGTGTRVSGSETPS